MQSVGALFAKNNRAEPGRNTAGTGRNTVGTGLNRVGTGLEAVGSRAGQLNGDGGLHQIRKDLLLKRHEVFAHIGVANRSKGKTKHDAFAAFDEEADALRIGFVLAQAAQLHK